MKKSILAIVLVLVLALAFTACGGGEKPTDETTKFKVYLITMDQMDSHWASVDEGCKKAVQEIGEDKIEYIWDAPDKKDDAKQIEVLNNAVANGADFILIAANGPEALAKPIEDAAAQGVNFIYVDSPANWDGALQTIATDNKAAGTEAGKQMLAALTEAGVTTGDIGIVNVKPDTTSCVLREQGFRAAFEGTEFNILETQFGEGDSAKSKDLADNFITQGVVGLFGANEGGTVGIGNAIKEAAGSKVIGVGFDKGGSVPDLVKEGVLLCTMAQNPDQMGYLGMKAAYDFLANGTTPAEKNVDSGAKVMGKSDF